LRPSRSPAYPGHAADLLRLALSKEITRRQKGGIHLSEETYRAAMIALTITQIVITLIFKLRS